MGQMNIRLDDVLHRRLRRAASVSKRSLQGFVSETLRMRLDGELVTTTTPEPEGVFDRVNEPRLVGHCLLPWCGLDGRLCCDCDRKLHLLHGDEAYGGNADV